jgi:hypothetical protein
MSPASTPRSADIEVSYYDHKLATDWASYFCLKYKNKAGDPQTKCITTPINGSDTMKTVTFRLTDAYFGGKVSNSDFRIECRTDAAGNLTGNKDTRRWIDTLNVYKR